MQGFAVILPHRFGSDRYLKFEDVRVGLTLDCKPVYKCDATPFLSRKKAKQARWQAIKTRTYKGSALAVVPIEVFYDSEGVLKVSG